jgi:hypothetical protein
MNQVSMLINISLGALLNMLLNSDHVDVAKELERSTVGLVIGTDCIVIILEYLLSYAYHHCPTIQKVLDVTIATTYHGLFAQGSDGRYIAWFQNHSDILSSFSIWEQALYVLDSTTNNRTRVVIPPELIPLDYHCGAGCSVDNPLLFCNPTTNQYFYLDISSAAEQQPQFDLLLCLKPLLGNSGLDRTGWGGWDGLTNESPRGFHRPTQTIVTTNNSLRASSIHSDS